VNPALMQRQAALAGVALLATIGALALGRESAGDAAPLPPAPRPSAQTWQEGEAGLFPSDAYGETTTCGVALTRDSVGVAHPVLPCGVDLVVAHGAKQERVEVILRGPVESGRELNLTAALARELGFPGQGLVRWRFAG
jgi:hypothetical protein